MSIFSTKWVFLTFNYSLNISSNHLDSFIVNDCKFELFKIINSIYYEFKIGYIFSKCKYLSEEI